MSATLRLSPSYDTIRVWRNSDSAWGEEMKRLERLRRDREWTVDYLAEESGTSRATIHRLERGHSRGHLASLEALAWALDVDLSHCASLLDEVRGFGEV
jgi:transcriptional regulator with XRE-family HTH domain